MRQLLRQALACLSLSPCLTLSSTLAATLAFPVFLSFLSPLGVYGWTLGIGVAGICVCGALACDLRGACPGAYLGIDRAEISRLLRFGEISPLRRLANTRYYALRFLGPACYSVRVI